MIARLRFELRKLRWTSALIAGYLLLGVTGTAIPTASGQQLADGNSYINVDTSAQATVFDWVVEEPVTGNLIDHLTELSNWYRVDDPNSVPHLPTGPETSIHPWLSFQSVSNTNGDPRPDTLTANYVDVPNHFEVRIVYNITGGGPNSGFSQLDEDIRIFNTSFTEDLYIHFFEYVDLDLHGMPDDDTLSLGQSGPGSLHQSDAFTDAYGTYESDHYEFDLYSNTLDKLMDANVDDLNDSASAGPGNVTWALQFDFAGDPPGNPPGFRHLISPRQTATIHKEGHLQMYYVPVPEPASGCLAAFGGTAVLLLSRKRTYSG